VRHLWHRSAVGAVGTGRVPLRFVTAMGRRDDTIPPMTKLRTLSLPIVGVFSFAAYQLVSSAGGATLANGFWSI